ncbi:MAG TPA: hypothetical protein VMO26_18620 [Vicinamibacterales bacterium]|nr:hypothetical protein [Vicinamibacterales bacterium]
MVVVLGFCLSAPLPAFSQPPFDAKQLANYRLSLPVFKRFAHATRLLAPVLRSDPSYQQDPLFSKEISVAGDAVEMATALRERLDGDAALAAALFAADISAHEYATFALALLAARLAHGFMDSGVLRRVPPGVAADNVGFVRDHLADIRRALAQLGLE